MLECPWLMQVLTVLKREFSLLCMFMQYGSSNFTVQLYCEFEFVNLYYEQSEYRDIFEKQHPD